MCEAAAGEGVFFRTLPEMPRRARLGITRNATICILGPGGCAVAGFAARWDRPLVPTTAAPSAAFHCDRSHAGGPRCSFRFQNNGLGNATRQNSRASVRLLCRATLRAQNAHLTQATRSGAITAAEMTTRCLHCRQSGPMSRNVQSEGTLSRQRQCRVAGTAPIVLDNFSRKTVSEY